MILLVVIMVLMGIKRGMNYWGWVFGYMAISIFNLFSIYFARNYNLVIISSIICVVYLIVFMLWPVLVTDEQKRDMAINAEKYKQAEQELDEEREERQKYWVVVKFYNDREDAHIFKMDKESLDVQNVLSVAKSGLGITTISVHKDNFDIACKILNVVPEVVDADIEISPNQSVKGS